MKISRIATTLAMIGAGAFFAGQAAAQEGRLVAGAGCNNPPRINCPGANCLPELSGNQGPAVEPKSGRRFFLDYPCDLKPGEKVTFVLNIHGGGSVGNWQRHYFPAVDFKEKHRLVVATPTAAAPMPGRSWQAAADDQFLRDVSDLVIRNFGRQNIKSFWLAGHSQGGATSRRIVCSPYFRDKVDGFLSLSGGRVGSPPAAGRGGATPAPPAAGRGGQPPAAGRGPAAPPAPLDCDFSFIFAIGELEASGQNVPAVSTWAEKYACGPKTPAREVTDTRAGYVTATDQSRGPSWGRHARPGVSRIMTYPGCKDGRVVADVVRIDKGHTEGLEPVVMDEIIKIMLSAKGGKLQQRG